MNTDPPDPDPLTDDDIAVEAVVEGTATVSQQRLVDGDGLLQERVAELVALRAALAEAVTPLPAARADEMIRTALDASEQRRPGENIGATPTSPARSDRTAWLVAAAVAILLALGAVTVPRLTAGRSDSSDSAASSAISSTTTALASSGGAGARTENRSSGESAALDSSVAPDSLAGLVIYPLGSVDTTEDLVARAVTALTEAGSPALGPPAVSTAEPTDDSAARACLTALASDDAPDLIAAGSIAGVEHLVLVTTTATSDEGGRSVLVVRVADCSIVGQFRR